MSFSSKNLGASLQTAPLLLTLVAVLAAPSFAEAQADENREFQLQRMRWSMGTEGIIDVESGQIPDHLMWDVAGWLDYANDPLVLYSDNGGSLEPDSALVAHRLGGSVQGSVGIKGWVHIGAELPFVLYQTRDENPPGVVGGLPSMAAGGLGDLRIIPRVSLLRAEDHKLDMALSLAFTLPTATSDAYLGEKTATFVPELALSRSWGAPRVAFNVAYRVRRDEEIANTHVGDEFELRGGFGWRFDEESDGPPLEVDVSFSVATQVDDFYSGAENTFAELRPGLTYRVGERKDIWLFGGMGIGLARAPGAPDYRLFAGVRFAPRPEPDADEDGIVDRLDECPDDPEDVDQFEDEDGCPDPDNDQDGILDAEDECPDIPEDMDGYHDDDGCSDPAFACYDGSEAHEARLCPPPPAAAPPPPRLVRIVGDRIVIDQKIQFELNSAEVDQASWGLLDEIAEVMINHPEVRHVEIQGHTDSEGSARLNMRLSRRRATSVMEGLVERGVAAERLSREGYGETMPIDDSDTRAGRAANRRVEFHITEREGTSREAQIDEDGRVIDEAPPPID